MKNTFSFRHDFGARNDPKIRKMIARLGPASGWAWWVTVEELFEQGGRMPLESICEIAYDAHVPEEMVRSIIYDFDLFKVTKKEFYSERINFELTDKESRSSAAKKNANARWDKYKKEKQIGAEGNAIPDASASENDAKEDAGASKNDAKKKEKEKGKEKGKEEDEAGASGGASDGSLFPGMGVQVEPSPKEIMKLWNDILNETGAKLPRVQSLSEQRIVHINARLRAFKERGKPLVIAERLIRKGCASKFLISQRWFNFDWIFCAESNWQKLDDGNYDDRTTTNNGAATTGYDRLHNAAQSAEEFKGRFYVSPQSGGNGGDAS